MDMQNTFTIHPVGHNLEAALREKIDRKTKPEGALGVLETLALRIGLIQNSLTPFLSKPTIVICAGDHGVVAEGISPYPTEATAQAVSNLLQGGTAINVFAKQNGLNVVTVDAGVDFNFQDDPRLLDAKVAPGTNNFVDEAAMTRAECEQALQNGAAIVTNLHRDGCNVVGFGDIGVGNTASASLLMSVFCDLSLERCTGPGSGLDEDGVFHKIQVLKRARQRVKVLDGHHSAHDPITVLQEFGGFELVMLCGGILQAAELGMLVLVDGFPVTTALLAARAINPNVLQYCIASHCSKESGHAVLLRQLSARALLDLDLRLGEGTGAALAYPLVEAAVGFLNTMASFETAGIGQQDDS